ncbi:MAG TPA: hypothetical protein HA367_04225 [Candidatus Methanofastidiosum sp.]|nr:hypothetical protein [Methanofastidiosum sp.]
MKINIFILFFFIIFFSQIIPTICDYPEKSQYFFEGSPMSVSLSPDGKFFVAGSSDYYVYLFERYNPNCINKYKTKGWVESVSFSTKGNYIVAGVHYYDYKNGNKESAIYLFDNKLLYRWDKDIGDGIHSVSISGKEDYIIGGDIFQSYLYDLNGNQIDFDSEYSGVDVFYNNAGNYFLTVDSAFSIPSEITIYDSNQKIINTITILGYSYEAAISNRGDIVVESKNYKSDTHIVSYYDLEGKLKWSLPTRKANEISITPNGSIIALATDNFIVLYDSDRNVIWESDEKMQYSSVSISSDGDTLVFSSYNDIYEKSLGNILGSHMRNNLHQEIFNEENNLEFYKYKVDNLIIESNKHIDYWEFSKALEKTLLAKKLVFDIDEDDIKNDLDPHKYIDDNYINDVNNSIKLNLEYDVNNPKYDIGKIKKDFLIALDLADKNPENCKLALIEVNISAQDIDGDGIPNIDDNYTYIDDNIIKNVGDVIKDNEKYKPDNAISKYNFALEIANIDPDASLSYLYDANESAKDVNHNGIPNDKDGTINKIRKILEDSNISILLYVALTISIILNIILFYVKICPKYRNINNMENLIVHQKSRYYKLKKFIDNPIIKIIEFGINIIALLNILRII